jgi:hypothetical protein
MAYFWMQTALIRIAAPDYTGVDAFANTNIAERFASVLMVWGYLRVVFCNSMRRRIVQA